MIYNVCRGGVLFSAAKMRNQWYSFFAHGPIFQSLRQLWLPKLAPTVTTRDVPSGLVDERYFLLQGGGGGEKAAIKETIFIGER